MAKRGGGEETHDVLGEGKTEPGASFDRENGLGTLEGAENPGLLCGGGEGTGSRPFLAGFGSFKKVCASGGRALNDCSSGKLFIVRKNPRAHLSHS